MRISLKKWGSSFKNLPLGEHCSFAKAKQSAMPYDNIKENIRTQKGKWRRKSLRGIKTILYHRVGRCRNKFVKLTRNLWYIFHLFLCFFTLPTCYQSEKYCAPQKKCGHLECGSGKGAQKVSATALRAADRWRSRGREPPQFLLNSCSSSSLIREEGIRNLLGIVGLVLEFQRLAVDFFQMSLVMHNDMSTLFAIFFVLKWDVSDPAYFT